MGIPVLSPRHSQDLVKSLVVRSDVADGMGVDPGFLVIPVSEVTDKLPDHLLPEFFLQDRIELRFPFLSGQIDIGMGIVEKHDVVMKVVFHALDDQSGLSFSFIETSAAQYRPDFFGGQHSPDLSQR